MVTHKQDAVNGSEHNHAPSAPAANHGSNHVHDSHGHDAHVHDTHGQDAHTHNSHAHDAHAHDTHGHDAHTDNTHDHDTHADSGHGHDSHEHNAHGKHGGHDSHEHSAHGKNGGHGGHDAHGHGDHGGHDTHGHGGHGGHGAHGGHDAHGHGGHGGHGGHASSKLPQAVGFGTVLGLLILLGIPTIFTEFDRFFGDQVTREDVTTGGAMGSYTVSNARLLEQAQVVDVQHTLIETPKSRSPATYMRLATGERFMAMDMTAFRTLGISDAAIHMSKAAYRKAKNLTPGTMNLIVTGEPPIEFILVGIEAVVLGIE